MSANRSARHAHRVDSTQLTNTMEGEERAVIQLVVLGDPRLRASESPVTDPGRPVRLATWSRQPSPFSCLPPSTVIQERIATDSRSSHGASNLFGFTINKR